MLPPGSLPAGPPPALPMAVATCLPDARAPTHSATELAYSQGWQRLVAKCLGAGTRLPGFKSQHCLLLAVYS